VSCKVVTDVALMVSSSEGRLVGVRDGEQDVWAFQISHSAIRVCYEILVFFGSDFHQKGNLGGQ
jgi:hypothetical protein